MDSFSGSCKGESQKLALTTIIDPLFENLARTVFERSTHMSMGYNITRDHHGHPIATHPCFYFAKFGPDNTMVAPW